MIVVTGGAGMIGYNLVTTLNNSGRNDIIIVDNLNHDAKKENLSKLKYHTYFDKQEFLQELPSLSNIEIIYHQGACSSTTETNEDYLQSNNVAYSKTLLHYALDNNIPFIYASSASVYGNGELGFSDNSNHYFPINGYAKSKLDFDIYVTNLLESAKIKSHIVGLRYFNVYGYGEAHKLHMSSVVYKFYQSYLANQPIQLFEGSDKILRDFISVDDIVKVNLFFAEANKPSGIYNVGTGKAASFAALAKVFNQKFNNAQITKIPFPDLLKGKYQYFTEADISKLKTAGYTVPFLNIENGVLNYINQLINE